MKVGRFGEDDVIEEQLTKLLRMRDAGSKLAEQRVEQEKLRQACLADEALAEGREQVLKAIGKVCS